MRLEDAKLGDEIIVFREGSNRFFTTLNDPGVIEVRAKVIGTQRAISAGVWHGKLLGWKTNDTVPNAPYISNDVDILVPSAGAENRYVDNIDDYKFGYWVADSYPCKMAFIDPDQVCIECKLPCPHAQPNHDNGYMCKSCQFLTSIGA
jgi:hypothetical protein